MEASARCCKELSAYCAAMVLRMSFSCSYTLSTPSVEGAAKVSSSAVMIAKFWMALVKATHCPPPFTVDHPSPLCLECGLAVMQLSELGLNSCSLADKLASSLCIPALSFGL
jgi:hypothetical protein